MRPETEHVLNVLRTAMRVLGFRNRDIERKLGASPGYLSRAMELEPGEIFRAAYPVPATPPSDAAAQIRKAVASFSGVPGGGNDAAARQAPAPPPSGAAVEPLAAALAEAGAGNTSPEEIEVMMARALRRFFKELAETGNAP
jgi:hypothetical protein